MKHTILITNDDGIDSPGIRALIQGLHEAGYPLVVCAPDRERSASTMHLTLHRVMQLKRRNDLLKFYNTGDEGAEIHIFDITGYPADCILTALSGGLPAGTPIPSLCISGINRGPNMSVDVLHSGTIGAARQAGTCGLPAIATSLNTFEPNDYSVAVKATLELVEKVCEIIPKTPKNLERENGSKSLPFSDDADEMLRTALIHGDIYLNLNTPVDWQGEFYATHLGGRWYRGAIEVVSEDDDEWGIKLGASEIIDDPIEHGDSHRVNLGWASVSTLGTWPQGHPLAISDELLAGTINENGLSNWLI